MDLVTHVMTGNAAADEEVMPDIAIRKRLDLLYPPDIPGICPVVYAFQLSTPLQHQVSFTKASQWPACTANDTPHSLIALKFWIHIPPEKEYEHCVSQENGDLLLGLQCYCFDEPANLESFVQYTPFPGD